MNLTVHQIPEGGQWADPPRAAPAVRPPGRSAGPGGEKPRERGPREPPPREPGPGEAVPGRPFGKGSAG